MSVNIVNARVRRRQSQLIMARDPFLPYERAALAQHEAHSVRDNLTREREEFEIGLGHFLSTHERSLSAARQMARAAREYISVRTATSKQEGTYAAILRRIQRPVALPFAGRAHGMSHLHRILDGQGSVRELLSAAWLTMSHLVTEDLVGESRLENAIGILESAGFDVECVRDWIGRTISHYHGTCHKLKFNDSKLAVLDPYDLFRLEWHSVRKLQLDSRMQFFRTEALSRRVWSRMRKMEFLAEGGKLSCTESELVSPLGRNYIPWMDARRIFLPNPKSELVSHALKHSIPLVTGASGVAIQIMKFGEIMNVDARDLRLALFGYLMSIKAHSFFELQVSTVEEPQPTRTDLDYRFLGLNLSGLPKIPR